MDLAVLLSDYELLQPEWLWLITPLIIYIFIRPFLIKKQWIKQNNQPSTISVKHPYALDNTALHLKTKQSTNIFTTLLAGSLIALALAQPIHRGEKVTTADTSADIMLIIDTSISMVIRDYQLDGKRVDRMTMTQTLLDRFSRRFSGQRIGIVIFGDPPQILLKPSKDKDLVRHLIHRLEPTVSGRMAALGDAIAIAADFVKSDKQSKKTVLVLISDATTPVGKLSPIEGAKRAAESNTVLHTIAIGSTDTTKNNMSASQMGELLYEASDVELLSEMAKITGGESFHGTDVKSIDAALDYIEKRHQVKSSDRFSPRKTQALYFWPLLLAILLLGMKELFSIRNKKSSNA